MNEWLELLEGLGIFGIIAACVTYLVKKSVDGRFNTKLEGLKSDLEISKHMAQIKFSSLHKERAEIAKEIFYKLHDVEQSIYHYTSIFQGPEIAYDESRFETAKIETITAQNLVDRNAFFFEDSLKETIRDIISRQRAYIDEMLDIQIDIRHIKEARENGEPAFKPEKGLPAKRWRDLETKAKSELKELRLKTENEFSQIFKVSLLEQHTKL